MMKKKRRAPKYDDGCETEELLSDTEKDEHSKRRHRRHYEEQHHWLSEDCPACGAVYIGNSSFCHICKRPRDFAGSDFVKEKKRSKKDKKDKRARVSPNGSIHMHTGSPYIPELHQMYSGPAAWTTLTTSVATGDTTLQ